MYAAKWAAGQPLHAGNLFNSCERASLPTLLHTSSPQRRGPACPARLPCLPALPALQDQDDWVPMDVVRDLVAALYASSAKLLADICPADELNWQEL